MQGPIRRPDAATTSHPKPGPPRTSRLFLSRETVKTHVSSVLLKLGARDRTLAVIAAYESGFMTA
jgi:hypothetical protein